MDILLILLRKDGTKKVFPVRNKATTLGRGSECDLCIPLQVVSRKHCQLNQEENALKVRDLSSSNGTFLNGQKISNETEVKAGDNLQVGPLTFAIQINGQPTEIPVPDSAIIQPTPDISEANHEEMNRSGTFTG
jgi:pSer/pThr/pTyr-binding forkhead associated (FHA) protein